MGGCFLWSCNWALVQWWEEADSSGNDLLLFPRRGGSRVRVVSNAPQLRILVCCSQCFVTVDDDDLYPTVEQSAGFLLWFTGLLKCQFNSSTEFFFVFINVFPSKRHCCIRRARANLHSFYRKVGIKILMLQETDESYFYPLSPARGLFKYLIWSLLWIEPYSHGSSCTISFANCLAIRNQHGVEALWAGGGGSDCVRKPDRWNKASSSVQWVFSLFENE